MATSARQCGLVTNRGVIREILTLPCPPNVAIGGGQSAPFPEGSEEHLNMHVRKLIKTVLAGPVLGGLMVLTAAPAAHAINVSVPPSVEICAVAGSVDVTPGVAGLPPGG